MQPPDGATKRRRNTEGSAIFATSRSACQLITSMRSSFCIFIVPVGRHLEHTFHNDDRGPERCHTFGSPTGVPAPVGDPPMCLLTLAATTRASSVLSTDTFMMQRSLSSQLRELPLSKKTPIPLWTLLSQSFGSVVHILQTSLLSSRAS